MLSRRAYTYKVTVPPASLAVTLATAKAHLKVTSTAEDDLITLYLEAAIDYAEKLTRRDLITRTYETFRDFFPAPSQNEGYYPFGQIPSFSSGISAVSANVGFEIRKSPLQTVEKIEYFSQAVLTELDSSIYYNTVEEDYSEVLTNENTDWPTSTDQRLQAIRITFKSGFGDSEADIPQSYQTAILQHVAALYSNRGDCSSDACGSKIPAAAKTFYIQNRIENL